jgi:acyl-coenzyme A synthetase/AMP-(fatty) acid ligase
MLIGFGGMHAEASGEEVIAYCRVRLVAYKYPREIRFMTELPKGPSGKILKSALRDGSARARCWRDCPRRLGRVGAWL